MQRILKILGIVALLAACASGNGSSDGYSYVNTIPDDPRPFNEVKAAELVAEMRAGWNLGNSLDADGGETAWGNPRTTIENIAALKDAGFNTIRIPVSWHNGANRVSMISDNWMRRVGEVVDYAVENDMYVILNTHHDEGIFKFKNADYEKSLVAFQRIWEQIAGNFKNYDEKLIFEGLNEPRTKGSAAEWSGGTDEERKNLNKFYQVFVDTVRAQGSNNEKRFLIINPYAASAEKAAMDGLVLPSDAADDKLIVSYHSYSPYNFALNTGSGSTAAWSKDNTQDASAITSHIDRYYGKFVAAGIPVIIGEMGAMNRDNAEARAQWAEFYFAYAKSKGIPCIWWDNGVTTGSGERFGLLNRRTNQFTYQPIVDAIMSATE